MHMHLRAACILTHRLMLHALVLMLWHALGFLSSLTLWFSSDIISAMHAMPCQSLLCIDTLPVLICIEHCTYLPFFFYIFIPSLCSFISLHHHHHQARARLFPSHFFSSFFVPSSPTEKTRGRVSEVMTSWKHANKERRKS